MLNRVAIRGAVVASAAIALAACASGYQQFYQPVAQSGPVKALPFVGEPQVLTGSGNTDADVAAAYTRGLGPIGYASFNGPNEGMAGAIAQAKKMGASHIVVSAQYSRTVSGAMPLVVPQTYTSTTSGTASVVGSRGYATGYYNGTTTTTGTSTTYIPYSVDRYDQSALFLAPLEKRGLGVKLKALTPAQAQELGTGKAMLVDAVRAGSPAFQADILPGDFVKSIGGMAVYDTPSMAAALNYQPEMTLIVVHRGAEVAKVLRFGPDGTWPN